MKQFTLFSASLHNWNKQRQSIGWLSFYGGFGMENEVNQLDIWYMHKFRKQHKTNDEPKQQQQRQPNRKNEIR